MNDRVYDTRPGRKKLPTPAEMPAEEPSEEVTEAAEGEGADDEAAEEAHESHPRKSAHTKAKAHKHGN